MRIDDVGAAAIVVDPAGAGAVDDDLDYLIAKRIGTLDGWHAFLAAHASGAHARSAEAEIDKLSPLVRSFEPAAAPTSFEAKVDNEAARPALASEAATPPLHEVCNHDGDCRGDSLNNTSGDEITRAASEPEPGKPGPQVANLTDGSAPAADEPNFSAKVLPDPGSKPRAIALHHGTTVSPHNIPRRRQQPCGFRIECQPLVMALLGVKPKHSMRAVGQTLADARPER